MNLTANYALGKPLGTEDYDIAVPNANMDIIDGLLKARADADSALDNRLDLLETGMELPFYGRLTTAAGTIAATAMGTAIPGASTLAVILARKALCAITFRAVLEIKMTSGSGDLRAYPAWTGATVGDSVANVYPSGAAFDNMLFDASTTPDASEHKTDHELTFHKVLEAGTTTFTAMGYRTGAGVFGYTTIANVMLNVTPIRLVP